MQLFFSFFFSLFDLRYPPRRNICPPGIDQSLPAIDTSEGIVVKSAGQV
jgi:hypothetical protein